MNRYFLVIIWILLLFRPALCPTLEIPGASCASDYASIALSKARDRDSESHEYFVDCGVAQAEGDGRSAASPWHGVDAVNAHTFSPGDVIHFKRGTECHGLLWPKGSGSESAVIRLTSYGEGARPRVSAKQGDEESFKLFNQEYWDVDSMEFSGGTVFGVLVSGDAGILHHIHLSNLEVHDVYGGKVKSKDTGLVVFARAKAEQHFDDVLVEGVTAYHTTQWAGILIGGGNFGFLAESAWNTHVMVRNSVVHDVYGDGIVLFRVRDGRIDTSAAWHTGMQPTESIGTPNAIWTWMCTDCVVSQNEAFLTDSPGVDGGAFDIDYGNTRNSVLENYAHDTQGYCVSVFGAGGVTRDSVVQGNLCINNGRSPRMAFYQGAIFLWTWNDGQIENLRVEKNTIYWAPPGSAPALINHADLRGRQRVFRDNHIYSSSPWIVDSNREISLQSNRYTPCGIDSAKWVFDGHTYDSLQEFRGATGQEQASAWEAASRQAPCLSLGQSAWPAGATRSRVGHGVPGKTAQPKPGWRVASEVSGSIESNGMLDPQSAAQLTVLKNLSTEYRSQGLQIKVILHLEPGNAGQSEQNVIRDLDLRDIQLTVLSGGHASRQSTTSLIAPDGSLAVKWQGFVGPASIGLAIRGKLGQPFYSLLEPDPQFNVR